MHPQMHPKSFTVCLERDKIGNELIYRSNHVFGIDKNKKGIDFLNPMKFHSFYFKILLFLLGFELIPILNN